MTDLSHSELLQLRASLAQLDWQPKAADLSNEIKTLQQQILPECEIARSVQQDLDQLHTVMRRFLQHQHSYQIWLDQQIAVKRSALIRENQAQFLEPWNEAAELERAGCWRTSKHTKNILQALIGKHADWRFPVLYYQPNSAELTRLLVHGDPYYVVDHSNTCIDRLSQHLPKEMRRKLLYYSQDTLAHSIPNSSIGLIVSWNNFSFRHIKHILQAIELLASKLLPGGCMLFDFNDGDTVQGSRNAQAGLMSFAWQAAILQQLKNSDLTVINHTHDADRHVSYMLVQRRGELPPGGLVNKVALVQKNPVEAQRVEQEQAQLRAFYENLSSRLQDQTQEQKQRDQELNQLAAQHSINHSKVLSAKMDRARAHLTATLTQHGKKHPASIHAMIAVAALAYAMGRYRDVINIHKQTQHLMQHVTNNSTLQDAFQVLETLVRNIDQTG